MFRPVTNTSDHTDLLDVSVEISEQLALVRETRIRLEKRMVSDSVTPAAQAKFSSSLAQLAAMTKNLSMEARLWAEVIRKLGETATPEQRTAAAVTHLTSLPLGLRANAYRAVTDTERRANNPLGLSLSLPEGL